MKNIRAYKIPGSIDIQCEIEPVAFDDMANREPGEPSAAIRERVLRARQIQQERPRPHLLRPSLLTQSSRYEFHLATNRLQTLPSRNSAQPVCRSEIGFWIKAGIVKCR